MHRFALVLSVLVSSAGFVLSTAPNPITQSLVLRADKTYSVVNGRDKNAVSWATFSEWQKTTGWALLELGTNGHYDNPTQAYAAGYLEGYMTRSMIFDNYRNVVNGSCEKMGHEVCIKVQKFVEENLRMMESNIELNRGDIYWHQISLVLSQLQGMAKGYNSAGDMPSLTFADFLTMGIIYDFNAISAAVSSSKKAPSRMVGTGSCSALVKILPDFSDVLFAHDTWTEFQTMLRIYKHYDFQFTTDGQKGSEIIPGARIAFSSYPMAVFSGDDFYTIGSSLAVMETTNGNYNPKLWKFVKANSTVLNLFRTIVANRLSTTAHEWTTNYIKYNSGSYNNQWMVFDYKKFEKNQRPQDGAFVVLEQIPGSAVTRDMTSTLIENGYWASYNIPAFEDIYSESGFSEMFEKYGNFFSHSECPRALIFKRNHSNVHDMDTMMDLMRYNNFKHDPLSKCSCSPPYSGENSIAARSDLNPKNGTYPIPALGHRMHGATDAKITSSSLIKQLSAVIVSGPTSHQLPVFSWSTSGVSAPHGHPDKFDFEPMTTHWENP